MSDELWPTVKLRSGFGSTLTMFAQEAQIYVATPYRVVSRTGVSRCPISTTMLEEICRRACLGEEAPWHIWPLDGEEAPLKLKLSCNTVDTDVMFRFNWHNIDLGGRLEVDSRCIALEQLNRLTLLLPTAPVLHENWERPAFGL